MLMGVLGVLGVFGEEDGPFGDSTSSSSGASSGPQVDGTDTCQEISRRPSLLGGGHCYW